jgi:hypothetical protein
MFLNSYSSRKLPSAIGGSVALLALVLAPAYVHAETKLQLFYGGAEVWHLYQAYPVTTPERLTFQWSTDEKGAVGGDWQVTTTGPGNKVTVVKKGSVTPAPLVGYVAKFTLDADAFLAKLPPAGGKVYNVTITPHDAQNKPLGKPSAAVVVTQKPSGPSTTKFDLPNPVFPSLKFVRYVQNAADLNIAAPGALKIRVSNGGTTPTDAIALSVTDKNFMVKSDPVLVPSLKPKASMDLNVRLMAHLPPPPNGLTDTSSLMYQWQSDYDKKGVDLAALLDWHATVYRTVPMYKGKTDSCNDGKLDGDETGADIGGCCGSGFGRNVNFRDFRQVYGFQFSNSHAFMINVGTYGQGDLQGLYGDLAIYIFTPFPNLDPTVFPYLKILNDHTKDGRCFGFCLAALRFLFKRETLAAYPSVADNTSDAPGPTYDTWHLEGMALQNGNINASPDLARLIHRQHALQYSKEAMLCYLDARWNNSAAYVKNQLKTNMPSILNLVPSGSGHSVVAHHMTDRADGGFEIDCYDPNVPWDPKELAPGELNKALTRSRVIVKGDGTYSYHDGAGAEYDGTASTDLTVFPYPIFTNPSMPTVAGLAKAVSVGAVSGLATITQVTDADGHRLFLPNGKVNYDPKTRIHAHPFYPLDGQKGAPARFIVMAANGGYTHTISATGKYEADFVGPNYAAHVEQISGQGGDKDQLMIDPKAGALAITTAAAKKDVHGKLIVRAADKSSRVATLQVTLSANAPVRLEFDEKRETLTYQHKGANTNLALTLWSSTAPKATYSGKPLAVENGDVLNFKPNWHQLDRTPGSVHIVKRSGTVTVHPLN